MTGIIMIASPRAVYTLTDGAAVDADDDRVSHHIDKQHVLKTLSAVMVIRGFVYVFQDIMRAIELAAFDTVDALRNGAAKIVRTTIDAKRQSWLNRHPRLVAGRNAAEFELCIGAWSETVGALAWGYTHIKSGSSYELEEHNFTNFVMAPGAAYANHRSDIMRIKNHALGDASAEKILISAMVANRNAVEHAIGGPLHFSAVSASGVSKRMPAGWNDVIGQKIDQSLPLIYRSEAHHVT